MAAMISTESPQSEIRTPSDLDQRHAQAAQRFVRAGELDRIYVSTWQEMGFLALEADINEDWKLLGYSSMGSWMMTAFPKSRSVVYAAWGAVRELKDVSPADLAQISHSTAHVLKKLPKALRQRQDVITAAKELSTKDFIARLKSEAPDAHIEQSSKRTFRFEESQERTVDAAIALAKLFNIEISRDEDAVEHICADYLLSNQQAFTSLRES